MQNITIAGRLGRDAELRSTQGGDQVCNFTVAVDTRQGREKVTNWWRVSLWGKRGEALAQYLTKGSNVTVTGEFSLSEYDGKPQLNIRANEITLQGGGDRQADTGGTEARGRASSSDHSNEREVYNSSKGGWQDDLDSDLPF